MKKIKITEAQAKKLGLLNEAEDSGLKSSGNAMGDLIVRVVISSPELPRYKDRALALVLRQDPTADIQYYEQTGKIVGNIKDIKRQSIERDLKALDQTITVEKKVATPPKLKEGVRNVIKLTKEQYNRIFASGLINESDDIKGGLTRVDNMAKKNFAGADVKNLKPVSEEEGITADRGSKFDIKKPNTQIPSSAQGKFGQPMLENEGAEDKIKKETIELIRYLYRKSEDLSTFWEENGLSYDDICTALLDKKLIIKKGGKYELSKALGDSQTAIQALETELRGLIGDKPKNEIQDAPTTDAPTTDAPMTDAPIDEYDNYNYPAGADADPNAPWHRDDPAEPSKMAKNPQLTPIVNNREITILKDPQGQMYAIYHDSIDRKEFYPYASVERKYVGKDEEGNPEYDYDYDNVEIDGDVVANYVNDNLASLSKGEGVEDWESGVELVKIDDSLKQELLSLYDKDKNIIKLLGSVDESESEGDRMSRLKAAIEKQRAKSKEWEDEFFRKRDVQNAIASANAEEKMKLHNKPEPTPEPKKPTGQYDIFGGIDETGCEGSSGAFTPAFGGGPMGAEPIKREMPDVPVIAEMGDGGNFGYDTSGGLTMDLGKNNPKTKAEKVPQYDGGSFVKSKNLGENQIFEAIAKKTGKTIEEVRQIINVKKSKA